jgi:hypothetical protein
MHDIKAMLTDDQKKALEDLWQDYPHMMRGHTPDNMPHMAPGNMPMHGGMR